MSAAERQPFPAKAVAAIASAAEIGRVMRQPFMRGEGRRHAERVAEELRQHATVLQLDPEASIREAGDRLLAIADALEGHRR